MYDGMKDMARTLPEEERAEPVYPYNLCISLTNEELEKLEIDCSDEDCDVDSYLHIHGLAKVTGIHKTLTDQGEQVCVNLQFTHLAVESEEEENREYDEDMSGMHGSVPY